VIVVGLDIESTGLDKVKDRPIELGLTLWTTKYNRGLESRSILVQSDGVKVTDEITEITGITQQMVDKFGMFPDEAFEEACYFVDLEEVEAIVAFNGRRFDIPMMKQWAKRAKSTFPDKLIIDPYEDLPMRPQELITMCAKTGIYYDPHEAGADVGAMLRLMAKFPFDVVLSRAKSSVYIVQSLQNRNENEIVKKYKFRWNPDQKIWWKAVKEVDMDAFNTSVAGQFGMQIREDLTQQDLDSEQQ
jgi:DNA polymerase III alpha subunit (gram-positive type)